MATDQPIPHPSEHRLAQNLALLANLPRPAAVPNGQPLGRDIYFSWDTEQGHVELTLADHPGALMAVQARVTGQPRWFSLGLGLGSDPFLPGQVIGLAIAHQAMPDLLVKPLIRSSQGAESREVFLANPLSAGPQIGHQVLLHSVLPREALAVQGFAHNLVLPLPRQDFTWVIQDMRFFVQTATQPALGLPQLGDWAV